MHEAEGSLILAALVTLYTFTIKNNIVIKNNMGKPIQFKLHKKVNGSQIVNLKMKFPSQVFILNVITLWLEAGTCWDRAATRS
jgi:hypothetical protein